MTLYLVQHGRSLPSEEDPEQGLSGEGRSAVERTAARAWAMGLEVSAIVHSGKKRAMQTAEILAAHLTPETRPLMEQGLAPLDDVKAFACSLPGRDRVMVVGHLPFMERLASLLVTGAPDRPVIRFTNGGIVCLEQEPGTDAWAIRWALTPDMA
jgi:phosphohistidine phosphatase